MDDEHGHSDEKSSDGFDMASLDPCAQALQQMFEYLDGELTDDRRDKIKSHLDFCAPCLQGFDFEAELRTVIARNCQEQVPDSLRQRIQAQLGIEE